RFGASRKETGGRIVQSQSDDMLGSKVVRLRQREIARRLANAERDQTG
ncbi:MAG: hypothetical protein JNM09_31720, partial [Blastocatellia bacterium]|nr:hypothetical protein [Blastocatellia bacterium]